MAMSASLRNKLIAAAGGGSMLIASLFIGGKDGVEGRVYKQYKYVTGVWTVCDGHTGTDIIKGKRYTDRECDRLLWSDLQPVKKTVDGLVRVPLNEYQRAALYRFTCNVGSGSFAKSMLMKKLNAGDQDGACEELCRWVYAGGMKFRGLMNRRDMERSMYLADGPDNIYLANADYRPASGIARCSLPHSKHLSREIHHRRQSGEQAIDDMQVRQRDVAALDAKYTKELADAQATIDQLHDDVDSGKRRLQLNATCPKQSASGTASVDDAASPGLTDSAKRDYFTLRSRIELAGKQIAGLQEYIRQQCLK